MFAGTGAVGRIGRPGLSAKHGASLLSGMMLALDFMSDGMLDPRITFTRASFATYTDASGVIQAAAVNQPRWDYANGVLRGLLIEEARTNLLLQSQDVNQAIWSKSGTITVTGTVAAPDGTTTGQTFNIAGAGTSAFSQMFTVTSGTRVEPSLWIKPISTSGVFTLENPGNTAQGLWSVNVALLNPAIWQRITRAHPAVTITNEFSGTSGNLGGLFIRTSGVTINASWWGYQLEQGAFPTSYIPTASVSVTRAVDSAVMPTNAGWWNPPAYSLSLEFDVPVVNSYYGGITDGAPGPNTSYFYGSQFAAIGGLATGSALTANAISKTCAAVNPASFIKISNNGGAVGNTSVSGPAQAGATLLAFGAAPWALGAAFSGHMRRANVWNRALSDAEMQQVTT